VTDAVERLRAALPGRVRADEDTRAAHRRDAWVLSELRELEGRPGSLPLAVVEPETTEEVAAALRACRETRTAVVTFGGGSGVCGGVAVDDVASRADAGCVVLALRRLSGLVALDERDLVARFRAGTLGSEAEALVEERGLTIGHWPQSIALSTVGGWVATRASGQYSTAYGSIEDIVLALEVVLPDGSVLRTRETPRAAAGPDLRQLFLGSEGTLGVVTEVAFSLRPLPTTRRGRSFHFASFQEGLEALRRVVRADWRPPVARLYDPRESRRHFRESCPKGRAMLILLHEGTEERVDVEIAAVSGLCHEAGGIESDPGAVDHWLATRNHVPSFRSFLEQGVVVDTIEVAATWERIGDLYDRVTRSLAEVPGLLAATAHSSHSYRSGTNLYFSFAVKPEDPRDLERAYEECWRRTMEATLAAGGGIAHHHGIGRVRRAYLSRELGEAGVAVLRAVKRALDPDGLLNPGNLLPPEEEA
jgi:alkyldihydroxyacetonephosphate synthase